MKKMLLILFFIPFFLFSQSYSVLLIPDSLKENANSVKRIDETYLTIKNPGKAILKHKWAITIFNEAASYEAHYYNDYSKFLELSDITGNLYDAFGNHIRKIKKKDIADQSESDGFSLLTDARFKSFTFYNQTYPYTVEFEDEVTFNGLYSFPKWMPVDAEKQSVQLASYIVEAPADYEIRVKQKNFKDAVMKNEKEKKVYTWELKNYKAIERENFQPAWSEIFPTVYVGVTLFEYGGYKGNMRTWKDYGLFQKSLNDGKDELPENLKAELHKLTDNLPTTTEKIEAVYNYLQQNSRYISIQLGIGGLQPFEAKYVAQKKYGDCKALSNFMVALLKEINIKAYHAVINAGENASKKLEEDFPRHYFNHMICCVPLEKDTMWLECTSQTTSAGYLGSFTGNRKALIITDDGGYIVNTPNYNHLQNTKTRRIDASIDEQGNLSASIQTIFKGIEQEHVKNMLDYYNQTRKEEYYKSYLGLSNYKIEKTNYKQTKGWIPEVSENIDITSQNYAAVTGKRIFIIPNVLEKNNTKLSTTKPRKFNIEYNDDFTNIDTVNIKVPSGFTIESIPEKVDIKNQFGYYSISYSFINNSIVMVRKYSRFSKVYPRSDYNDLVKFYDDIYKGDRNRIVLVKNS